MRKTTLALKILHNQWKYGVNRYTAMQKAAYARGTSDHPEHNENPDYWEILLRNVADNTAYWDGKKALDFACGKGRNIHNLKKVSGWSEVDGVDISEANIEHCKSRFDESGSNFYCCSGINIEEVPSEYYDFVLSTIALQHIPVHDIRSSIFKDIYRVMKEGALFSFQMGAGDSLFDSNGNKLSSYYENSYNASGTNSDHDVQITDPQELVRDLLEIGFKDIEYEIRPSFSDSKHEKWIYVQCYK